MEVFTERRRNYPMRGLWQAAARRLHLNSEVSIYIHDGHGERGIVAHDESELRQIWNFLVLPAAEAGKDVWITDDTVHIEGKPMDESDKEQTVCRIGR